VVVLCATEITNWGAMVYAVIVAASTIAATEGWRLTQLLGAVTVAQMLAGLAGVWVGRHIDAVGPRTVMTCGSILGAVALTVVASSTSLPAFYAGWVLAGLAMSAILYAPAFAAITGWAGSDIRGRVRALTAVTLVAGLASTVFAPLTAWLLELLGWRPMFLVMAALVVVTAPVHWWGLSARWPGSTTRGSDQDRASTEVEAQSFSSRDFRILVAAIALGGFCVHAVVVNLVPLLLENGLSVRDAATVMAVGGVGQVTGRIFYGRIAAATGPAARARLILGLVAVSTVALAETHSPLVLIAAVAFAGGMARGMFTLVQATAVSDRWGPTAYGARNGILSGTTMGASALAPWAGSLLADHVGGYAVAFWVLAAGMLVAAAGVRPAASSHISRV
jgi:MFS family permease